MSIQGNVNQIISLSGLLASQHPGIRAAAQKRSELRDVTSKLKTVEDRIALGHELVRSGEATGQLAPAYTERADLLKEKYKLDPSMESWEAYIKGATEARERTDVEKNIMRTEAENRENSETWKKPRGEEDVKLKVDYEDVYGLVDKEGFIENLEGQYEDYLYKDVEPVMPASAAAEARAKADASLTTEQTNRRETRDRTKGFTSQRYGTWGRTDNKAFKGGSR